MFDDKASKEVLVAHTRRSSARFETGLQGKYLVQVWQQDGKWIGRACGPIVDISNGLFLGMESPAAALETADTEEDVRRLIASALGTTLP